MVRRKRVFSDNRFNFFPLIILILFSVFIYVGYVFFFNKPSVKVENKLLSSGGINSVIERNDTLIKSVEIYFVSENKIEKKIYESNENFINEEIILNIPYQNDNEILKFLKKNENKEVIVKHKLIYENIFFDSEYVSEKKLNVDILPPRIFNIETDGYTYIGGLGFIMYDTSLDTEKTFVDNGNGDLFFPITLKNNENFSNLVFFSCSNKPCANNKLIINAIDKAGNVLKFSQKIRTIKNKKWDTITIPLPRELIRNKFNMIFNDNIEVLEKEDFLKMNIDERIQNDNKIKKITEAIHPSLLFDSSFKQLSNSKVSSKYSEKRRYYFRGNPKEIIDTKFHYGIDLSSIKNAPVYSSEKGEVVHVDDSLGIYGKVVIINHGLGFYSLYSHLSDIFVQIDDKVSKKTKIGTTGTTGFAFGDHLHYGIYLQGIPIDPVEFFDKNYLNIKIFEPYKKFINKKKN